MGFGGFAKEGVPFMDPPRVVPWEKSFDSSNVTFQDPAISIDCM